MPPTQCVKLRQNSSPLLIDSICAPSMMEAPVVVKPETASKKASI